MASPDFHSCYGPWALVAGASEGLGAQFATLLAERGLNVVVLARRLAELEGLASRLREAHGVEVRAVRIDLESPDFLMDLRSATDDIEVGLLVLNAAYAPVGAFLERPLEDHQRAVRVNVLATLTLVHHYAPEMQRRGCGGIVLMSSLAGFQGTPRLPSYGASKAFGIVFGEALWHELKSSGVHVSVCAAGAVRTPGLEAAQAGQEAPGTLDARVVARRALHGLGRRSVVIPGWVNRLAAFFLGRLIPRRWSVALMAKNTQDLN